MKGLQDIYEIDEVIAEIQLETGINDQLLIITSISNAIRELGTCAIYSKTVCLDVKNGMIKKPCDFVYGIDMNIIGKDGKIYDYTFQYGAGMSSDETIGLSNGIHISEQGETYFKLSKWGNALNSVELKYYAYPIDEYGDVMIPAPMKEAVKSFAVWKIKLRQHFSNPKKVTTYELVQWEQAWYRSQRQAIGEMKMPDPIQAESMLSAWVTRIPNFQKKTRKKNRIW